jgi:hypothetical protein
MDNVVNLEQKLLQNDVYIASLEARLRKDRSIDNGDGVESATDSVVLDEVRQIDRRLLPKTACLRFITLTTSYYPLSITLLLTLTLLLKKH